jgi:serine/threonine protein kinase
MLQSQIIADRYELRRQIGAGGTARVYLAWDEVLRRNVAIKVLNEAASADPAFVARFRREAQAAASLQSPNIVQVYDWGRTSNDRWPVYYLVMEYIDGPNVKEVIQERSALPQAEALRIGADIAAALEVAHRRGIVHRDIKPQNVLIGPGGTVKVTDFGIARATGLTQLTTTQSAVYGSAHYVSPEQAQRGAADERSDIYSLGVVLYEMLTGSEPFHGESLLEVVLQHVNADPAPPSQVHRGISAAVDAIVMRAMAKNPADRFPSAAAMRQSLLQARSNLVRPAPPPKPVASPGTDLPARTRQVPRTEVETVRARSWPPGQRRRRSVPSWLPILAVTVLVLGAGLGVLHALTGGAPSAAHHAGTHPAATTAASGHRTGAAPTARPAHQAAARPTRAVPTAAPTAIHHAPAARSGTGTGHGSSAGAAGSSGPAVVPTPAPTTALPAAPLPGPRPTTASHPAGPASSQGVSQAASTAEAPQQAVEAFYADISNHDFGAAAQLWTPSMQSRYPPATNIDDRFAATSSIDIRHWAIVSDTGDRATVAVTLMETLQSGTTRTLVGSWSLVRSGTVWLLDNPSF